MQNSTPAAASKTQASATVTRGPRNNSRTLAQTSPNATHTTASTAVTIAAAHRRAAPCTPPIASYTSPKSTEDGAAGAGSPGRLIRTVVDIARSCPRIDVTR